MASKCALPLSKRQEGFCFLSETGLVVASCGNAESDIGRGGRPLKANAVDPVLLQQLDLLLDGRENTARYNTMKSSVSEDGKWSRG